MFDAMKTNWCPASYVVLSKDCNAFEPEIGEDNRSLICQMQAKSLLMDCDKCDTCRLKNCSSSVIIHPPFYGWKKLMVVCVI